MSTDALFDGSNAHLLPAGIAECAAYLRKYNEWRRGDAEDNRESEMPHPQELGMNIDFAIAVLDAIGAHDHLMVIAATRYCLGRMTYIVDARSGKGHTYKTDSLFHDAQKALHRAAELLGVKHEQKPVSLASVMPDERACCGTFPRTPHRSTCSKFRGKKGATK